MTDGDVKLSLWTQTVKKVAFQTISVFRQLIPTPSHKFL